MQINGMSIGSSVDTETIIQAFKANWRLKYITPLETKKTERQSETSALSTLVARMSALKTKLLPLTTTSAFQATQAVSSDEDVVTAAADTAALPGTYAVSVTQLAAKHKIGSAQFVSANTVISAATGAGAHTFDITINGTTKNVTVNVGVGDTDQTVLSNIAAQINASGAEATAIVVNEDATHSRLLITANDTGIANTISIQDTAGTLMQSAQVIDGSGALLDELQAAKDALFTIDTLNFQRSSNTVSDAINGVTMQFKSLGNAQIDVEVDTESIKTSINDFITAYNDVINYVKSQTAYNSETKVKGSLLYYPVARTLPFQLRPFASSIVASQPEAFNSLAMIGITASASDGTLSISDSDALESALAGNLDDVKNLFAATDGVATLMKDFATRITDTDGALTATQQGVSAQIDRLNTLIGWRERSLASYESALRVKYSALDSLLTTNQTLLNSFAGFSLLPNK
jgi:flagellar hook-associated protein 2